jgi:hypothetical protein
MNTILEVRAEFSDGHLSSLTVLAEISAGDIRALYANNVVRNGYAYINQGEVLSESLIQRVADYGCEINEKQAREAFHKSIHISKRI